MVGNFWRAETEQQPGLYPKAEVPLISTPLIARLCGRVAFGVRESSSLYKTVKENRKSREKKKEQKKERKKSK